MRLKPRSPRVSRAGFVDLWSELTWTPAGPMGTGKEVAIFVVRADCADVLVARRVQVLGGHWHVVAGGVEEGELPAQAATRELHEETGLHASFASEDEVHDFSYAIPGSSGSDGARSLLPVVKKRVVCYLIEVESGWEPILNWEHDSYAWVGLDEACERLHWASMARALRHVVTARRTAAERAATPGDGSPQVPLSRADGNFNGPASAPGRIDFCGGSL